MILRAMAALAAGAFLMAGPNTLAAPSDPYVYMEEAEGAKALDFARAENARSLPQLQTDPRYSGLYADAQEIVTAKDRIPNIDFAGDGSLRDFWQDAQHVRGVWRSTSLASYRAADPAWKTILDLDALSKAENANWVWKGAQCLKPEERLCLVNLSNGGKDAVEVREFDSQTGQFVAGGFHLPEGKHRISWIDHDTLAVATDWTKDEVTASGYPYVVKLLKRGQPLSAATEVYRGERKDVAVSPAVLREPDGRVAAVLIERGLDLFNSEHLLVTPKGPVTLALPTKSTIQSYVHGKLIVTLEQDWPEKTFKQGDLLAFDLAAIKANPANLAATLILRPSASQAIEQVTSTKTRLVVTCWTT